MINRNPIRVKALCFKRRRYEQDKAREHLSTGAYNNARNQDTAERYVLNSVDTSKTRRARTNRRERTRRTRPRFPTAQRSIAKYIRCLRDEIEFYVANRNGIALFTAHFCKRFNNTAQAQYFLEILHRIGIV